VVAGKDSTGLDSVRPDQEKRNFENLFDSKNRAPTIPAENFMKGGETFFVPPFMLYGTYMYSL
jgi:hypothetical protein